MARFVVDVMLSRHGQMHRVLDWHRTIVEATDGFEAEQTAYLISQAQGWYPVEVTVIEDGTDPIAKELGL
jgi:hypothetical protein